VVAESAEAGPFLYLVRAAFALSNTMNWRCVISGLNNKDDDWNRIFKGSERDACQILDTVYSSRSFECFSSYAHLSEVMHKNRQILQSEHRIGRVLAILSSTSAPTGRRKRATSS
jgi:hypothetical protein